MIITTPPSRADMLAAIEHTDVYGDRGWTLDNFTLKFLGNLHVDKLARYDDLSSWLEAKPGEYRGESFSEKLRALISYRGSDWAVSATHWLKTGIPPIVVITAPDEDGVLQTMIGDGCGRVNFAVVMDMALPVWQLTYRAKRIQRKHGRH